MSLETPYAVKLVAKEEVLLSNRGLARKILCSSNG